MQQRKTPSEKPAQSALQALEREWGEPLVFRTTGRFLAAQGLGTVPLLTWGLVALTPTRLIFHHFSQSHPLFGGKTEEVRWDVERRRFASCSALRHGLWSKLLNGSVDHVVLSGPDVHLALETADNLLSLPSAWNTSGLDPQVPQA